MDVCTREMFGGWLRWGGESQHIWKNRARWFGLAVVPPIHTVALDSPILWCPDFNCSRRFSLGSAQSTSCLVLQWNTRGKDNTRGGNASTTAGIQVLHTSPSSIDLVPPISTSSCYISPLLCAKPSAWILHFTSIPLFPSQSPIPAPIMRYPTVILLAHMLPYRGVARLLTPSHVLGFLLHSVFLSTSISCSISSVDTMTVLLLNCSVDTAASLVPFPILFQFSHDVPALSIPSPGFSSGL